MPSPTAVVPAPTWTTAVRRPRLDSLTGLRAVAALAVFGRHIDPFLGDTAGQSVVHGLTVQGSAGVSLFFILSGFVLTWSADERYSVRDFWRRRWARIVPAYLVGLVLALGVTSIAAARFSVTRQDAFNATLLQSWIPDQKWYFAGNSVGWSLSTEMFFYLIAPYVIGAVVRTSRQAQWWLLCCCAVLAMVIPALLRPDADLLDQHRGWEFWLIYVSPPVRACEFVSGIALAALLRRGVRVPVKLGAASALAAMAYVVAGQVPVWAGYVAVTMVPFLLLVAAVADTDVRGRRSVLRHRVLVTAGACSYAFYLVHYSVVRLVDRFVVYGDQPAARTAAAVAACLVGAAALSWLLYAGVERPAERLLRPRRRGVRTALDS